MHSEFKRMLVVQTGQPDKNRTIIIQLTHRPIMTDAIDHVIIC